MRLSRRFTNHLLVGTLLVVAFLFMASIFVPEQLEAGAGGAKTPAPGARADGAPAPLGQLESERYVVRIYGTPEGPLYSVFDKRGAPLGLMMSGDEVARTFPDLPLPDARALQLMDAGTHDGER